MVRDMGMKAMATVAMGTEVMVGMVATVIPMEVGGEDTEATDTEDGEDMDTEDMDMADHTARIRDIGVAAMAQPLLKVSKKHNNLLKRRLLLMQEQVLHRQDNQECLIDHYQWQMTWV